MSTAPDKVRTECPHCGQKMRIKSKHLDKKITCPTCQNPFIVQDGPGLMPDGAEGADAETSSLSAQSMADQPLDPPAGDDASGGGGVDSMFGDTVADDLPPLDPADAFAATTTDPPADDDGFGDSADFVAAQSDGGSFDAVDDLPPLADDDDNPNAQNGDFLSDATAGGGDPFSGSSTPAPMPAGIPKTSDMAPSGVEDPFPVNRMESEPSKHMAPLLTDGETPVGEYALGFTGWLMPESSRVLVTDKNVYFRRTRRLLFGLIPGADQWTGGIPLASEDLRRIQIYTPSYGRMLLLSLIALAISAFAFIAMHDIQANSLEPDAREGVTLAEPIMGEQFTMAGLDEMAENPGVVGDAARWYRANVEVFTLSDLGTWYGTILPFLVVFLWYQWRFKAEFRSDAFRFPMGRGKKVAEAKEATRMILGMRANIQNRRGF